MLGLVVYFIVILVHCSSFYNTGSMIRNDILPRADVGDRNGEGALANVTTTNPFSGRNNESNFSWLDDALKDIAYYLRAHKFNDYDRRYVTDATKARRLYFEAFPQPALRSLHWEVHQYCEPSFLSCVQYLGRRVKQVGLKRTDDTAIVIQEQQWSRDNHSEQIDAVEAECRKMYKVDDHLADPFQGPLERFQWRVTASYYMCWYTMNEVPDLKHLKEKCDNYASCLDPHYGPNNNDPRASDDGPYSCALYSFCPDPCCPFKHIDIEAECWNRYDNPCFKDNDHAHRVCTVNRTENTDFRDIILNRWNVTCSCPQLGYKWNSRYSMCIDIDECVTGVHKCDPKREACVNLPGSFRCACKWGYGWDSNIKMCAPSSVLSVIKKQKNANDEKNKHKNATSIVKRIFNLFRKSNCCKTKGSKKFIAAITVIVSSLHEILYSSWFF